MKKGELYPNEEIAVAKTKLPVGTLCQPWVLQQGSLEESTIHQYQEQIWEPMQKGIHEYQTVPVTP